MRTWELVGVVECEDVVRAVMAFVLVATVSTNPGRLLAGDADR